jgi:hypothetical protein
VSFLHYKFIFVAQLFHPTLVDGVLLFVLRKQTFVWSERHRRGFHADNRHWTITQAAPTHERRMQEERNALFNFLDAAAISAGRARRKSPRVRLG